MSEPLPRRSAGGARQGGDDYQHLVAWNRILRGLMPGRRWAILRRDDVPTLMLITNRLADSADPAFSVLDGRTELLVPASIRATSSSPLGQHSGHSKAACQSMLPFRMMNSGASGERGGESAWLQSPVVIGRQMRQSPRLTLCALTKQPENEAPARRRNARNRVPTSDRERAVQSIPDLHVPERFRKAGVRSTPPGASHTPTRTRRAGRRDIDRHPHAQAARKAGAGPAE